MSITKSPSSAYFDDSINNAEKNRIKVRVKDPLQKALQLFITKDYDDIIKHHTTVVMPAIINNPIEYYDKFKKRLIEHGTNASFPEFEGVVAYLTKAIFQSSNIEKMCTENEQFRLMREILVHELMSIQIDNRLLYPYTATIFAIESMLKLLDIYYRTVEGHPEYPAYYHNFRYRTYLPFMIGTAPDNIIFPTCKTTGATDLIKMRCVPLFLISVVNEPLLGDQFINTPLDFWAHDLQHSRRQYQETERYYDVVVKHIYYYTARSPFDMITKDEFYLSMHNYTNKILQAITQKKEEPAETKAIKQWAKMLVFEIVHEKAWPISNFSICRNTKLGYDWFPVETIEIKTENQVSVLSTIDQAFRDPTTLSNLYNKIRRGFYDDVMDPSEFIIMKKYRTSKYLKLAVDFLLNIVKCSYKSIDDIDDLIFDNTNAGEFIAKKDDGQDKYPEVNEYDEDKEAYMALGRQPVNKNMQPWKIEEEQDVFYLTENLPKKTLLDQGLLGGKSKRVQMNHKVKKSIK